MVVTTREEMLDIYEDSIDILKVIQDSKKKLTELHQKARKEVYEIQEAIIKEEIETGNIQDVNEIRNKTGIHLDAEMIDKREDLFRDLYIKNNFEELLEQLRESRLTSDIQRLQSDYPKKVSLWGFFWKITSKKKKERLFKTAEELQQVTKSLIPLAEEIKLELSPVFNQEKEKIAFDFTQNTANYKFLLEHSFNVEHTKISKKDFKQQREEYNQFKNFSNFTMRLLNQKKDLENEVYKLIDDVNEVEIDKEMASTNLDEFSQLYPDNRLRLHLLAQAGIENVYQMKKRGSFLSVAGIGEVTNSLLQETLAHYKKEVGHSIGFRFEANEQTVNQTEILRNLYLDVNEKELIRKVEKLALSFKHKNLWELMDELYIRSEWAMQQLAKNDKLFNKNRQLRNDFGYLIGKNIYMLEDYDEKLDYCTELTKKEIWKDFNQKAADYYATLEKKYDVGVANVEQTIKRSGLSEEIIQSIHNFTLNEDELNATLRSWQEFGTKYTLLQKKTLIGDEMGLGKTLISIAAMAHLKAEKNLNHFVVICPASIMTNWEREVKRFSNFNMFKAHGTHRDSILEEWKNIGGIAITTYDTAQVLDFSDVEKLDMLTVDEAHYAKNPGAKRTQFVRKLTDKSVYAIYLTGTPLENEVEEMTQIIKPLSPEIAQVLRKPKMIINANEYRKSIAPVYLRRTKSDVALELPPLTQIEEWGEFGEEEFLEYKDAVENGKFMRMRRAAWVGGTPKESPKLKRLVELSQEAAANKNKVIVFTFFRDVIETVIDTLGDLAVGAIHGDVSIGQRQEIIDEFRESKTKNVLVAQINTAAHGLNIQFANTIIFCEPQIKPSLETQAVARAYRMGQVDNVFVYRLLTVNSVDELMMSMLDNKQSLFDEFADRAHIIDELEEYGEAVEKDTAAIQKKIIDLESERLKAEEKSNERLIGMK